MRTKTVAINILALAFTIAPLGIATANEEAEYTCEEAADNLSSVIDDWHQFIREMGAEDKNASVLAMHADSEDGVLIDKFTRQCVEDWEEHQDIFTCFSGVRSEMGAAMCQHPDTNKNGWRYE